MAIKFSASSENYPFSIRVITKNGHHAFVKEGISFIECVELIERIQLSPNVFAIEILIESSYYDDYDEFYSRVSMLVQ